MAVPFGAQGASTPHEISAAQVNHLPIVAHFARRPGLVAIVNRLVPTQMEVEPGVIVLGLVLDTLSGRSPLYHLQTAFEDCDRAVLFGQELPAEYFSDDNAGRMLDHLYDAGTQRVFSELSVAALEGFPVSTQHAHFDTTSVNLYGDYLGAQSEDAPFKITHGYSKDKRPDLKQFVLSLLCVDGNVPIAGKLEDGNASDKTINHRLLSEVSGHLHKHGVGEDAFIYIADSAMVTEPIWRRPGSAHALSRAYRLPTTSTSASSSAPSRPTTGKRSDGSHGPRPRRTAPGPPIACTRVRSHSMAKPIGRWWCTPVPTTNAGSSAWSAS
jgi:hypothetical protein